MQKIFFFIAATICLLINATTSISIDNKAIIAILDSSSSKTLYESLQIPPVSIAFGHYKEFHIKGELYNLRNYSNDISIECTEKLETTHECIIAINLINSWRTVLIRKNDYFNLIIKSTETKKQLMLVLPRAYLATDKGVIIDCHSESTCFIALSCISTAPTKAADKRCIIF